MAVGLDALNYPYIRVRSLDWLKQTLLIFPHVVRMTPEIRAPAEDPQISEFTRIMSGRYPLLRAADLNSTHVHDAQLDLVQELRGRLRRDPKFRARYGRQAAELTTDNLIEKNLTLWERRLSPRAIQIHKYKLLDDLTHFLTHEHLAWVPDYAHGPDYLEMHPLLGEAVMATLAMACAENEGFQVVTEFPGFHGKLIGTPREKILSACLDGIKRTGATSGQQIAEFLVYRRCNVDMVSAENIVALKDERAALAAFRTKLEDLASSLPSTVHSEKVLDEKLEDTLNDMFKEWKEEQANLGNTARKFFGDGFGSEFKKVAEKFTEAALKPETAADALIKGGVIGGVTGHVLTGIGAGFAIAVVFRAAESWSKARNEAKTSPIRYLTRLQEQGVSFSLQGGSPIATTQE
jgi:hypothetical protein